MKKLTLLFAFFTLSTTFCFAQDATYKAAVKKMLVLAGNEATYKVAISQMITMMKQQKNDVPDTFWNEMEQEMLKSAMTDLYEMLTPIYYKNLTLADINGMIAFYESPVGKKYAEKTPLIMQESMQVGQQWGMKLGQKIAEKLQGKTN